MAYQVTTKTGYGKRVKNSFGGIGAGFCMIIIGTALLWWNEGRAVKTSRMLKEASSVAVHVEDVSSLDPSLEGKLIHANAVAHSGEVLSDPTFGVSGNAIKISREVEFYQWQESSRTETKEKIGGTLEETTTYSYSKGWSFSPVNSSEFKDPAYKNVNTVLMNTSDASWQASEVSFGAYKLPESMVSSISCQYNLEANTPEALIDEWNRDIRRVKLDTLSRNFVHISGNVIYLGADPDAPEVGDVRVTFTKAVDGDATVMGVVKDGSFEPYVARNDKQFSGFVMGTKTMDDMFESRAQANKIMLWIWRIVGILLVIGGFKGIFNILITLLKVIPALSKIAGLGVNFVCNVLGFIWSFIVIMIAWLRYRPLIGILLLVAIVALVVLLVRRSNAAKLPETPDELSVE